MILVALAMVVGTLGTLIPFLPGLTLVWAAALIYGLVDGFGSGGWTAFAIISVLCALGLIAQAVIPNRKAASAGAAGISRLVGVVAAAVGFFVIPVVGLPVGGIAGVYVTERVRGASAGDAYRATRATLVGLGIGFLVQLVVAMLSALTWLAWVIWA